MSAWETPTAKCPYCGEECEADWVDVEVGMVQCGPYYCMECGASQIGPYDSERELTNDEKRTGWYAPGAPVGDSANTHMGVPVDHQTAKRLYAMGLLDPSGPEKHEHVAKLRTPSDDDPFPWDDEP